MAGTKSSQFLSGISVALLTPVSNPSIVFKYARLYIVIDNQKKYVICQHGKEDTEKVLR